MTSDTDPRVEIADAVRELTQTHLHMERYVVLDKHNRPTPAKQHMTRHPSLLAQLRDAATAGRGSGDEQMTGGYESRPTARLEALDQLLKIEQAVDDWLVRRLKATPRRHQLEDRLHQIVGLVSAETAQVSTFAREVNRWRIWARVVTGWDSPPWQPKVACPLCEHVGELRIRLIEQTAACLHCGETWDASTFGLLAEQIATVDIDAANEERARARLAAELAHYFPRCGPCLCGLPTPHDARHRLVERLVSEAHAGVDSITIATAYGVPVEAVAVALAAIQTFTHLEPYPRVGQRSA